MSNRAVFSPVKKNVQHTKQANKIKQPQVVIAALLSAALIGTALISGPADARSSFRSPRITYAELSSTGKSVVVSWPNTSRGARSYEVVYRPSKPRTPWRVVSAKSVGAYWASPIKNRGQKRLTKALKPRKAGFTLGRSYDIGVRAVSHRGKRSTIYPVSAVSMTASVPKSKPRATATSDGRIKVSWAKAPRGFFHQYDIYLSEYAKDTRPRWIDHVGSKTKTSWVSGKLKPGTKYVVGVRVTQGQKRLNDAPVEWVRTKRLTATTTTVEPPQTPPPPDPEVPETPTPSKEKYRTTAEHAFVSNATGRPVILNGVNIKRATHKTKGKWETPYVIEEIDNMKRPGAPAFNSIRLAMDWPYFQRRIDGKVQPDREAFAELDKVIAAAQRAKLDVILDPIHLANIRGYCAEDPVMNGARRDIPSWAWKKVGADPGNSCKTTSVYNELTDDVLALQETADYLKFILNRYDTDSKFGQTVVALDLVNEPHADGRTGPARTQKLVDKVFKPWLAPTGSRSLRAVDPDKPIIITPASGMASLKGVSFSGLNKRNVVLTFHDYFGQARGSDPTYGIGYDRYGWATALEATDQTSNDAMGSDEYVPYDADSKAFAERLEEHERYLRGFLSDAKKVGMPVFIGEYGIRNPCGGGNNAASTRYFKDTSALFDKLGLSRTVWANGYWDQMSIMWRGDSPCQGVQKWDYFDYAKIITNGKVNR